MVFLTLGVLMIVIFAIWDSFISLIRRSHVRGTFPIAHKLILLALIYVTIIIAFALLYVLCMLSGHDVLVEGHLLMASSFFHLLESVIYFSAVTLFSVGYGDITPIGIGRWIAIVEAMIGYLLPAAFFISTIYERRMEDQQDRKLSDARQEKVASKSKGILNKRTLRQTLVYTKNEDGHKM